MMNFTRTKTNEPEKWDVNTGGVKIAQAEAHHSSPTVRTWDFKIKIPMVTGRAVTGKITDVFSIKKGEVAINKFIKEKGIHVKDIKGYGQQAA